MSIKCPACQHSFEAQPDQQGQTVACPNCEAPVEVTAEARASRGSVAIGLAPGAPANSGQAKAPRGSRPSLGDSQRGLIVAVSLSLVAGAFLASVFWLLFNSKKEGATDNARLSELEVLLAKKETELSRLQPGTSRAPDTDAPGATGEPSQLVARFLDDIELEKIYQGMLESEAGRRAGPASQLPDDSAQRVKALAAKLPYEEFRQAVQQGCLQEFTAQELALLQDPGALKRVVVPLMNNSRSAFQAMLERVPGSGQGQASADGTAAPPAAPAAPAAATAPAQPAAKPRPQVITIDLVESELVAMGFKIPEGVSVFTDSTATWRKVTRPFGPPQKSTGNFTIEYIYDIEANQAGAANLKVVLEDGRFLLFMPATDYPDLPAQLMQKLKVSDDPAVELAQAKATWKELGDTRVYVSSKGTCFASKELPVVLGDFAALFGLTP